MQPLSSRVLVCDETIPARVSGCAEAHAALVYAAERCKGGIRIKVPITERVSVNITSHGDMLGDDRTFSGNYWLSESGAHGVGVE
jgi:hypothetical protein